MKSSKGIVRGAVKKVRALIRRGGSSSIYSTVRLRTRDNNFELIANKGLEYFLNGRRPGKRPPIRSLATWAEKKGIPKKALFPIAKKIGEQGLKGRKRVKRAVRRTLSKSYRDYAKALIREEAKKKH